MHAAVSGSASTVWAPLRRRKFRDLWLGGAAFFVGNAMHNMAASWLMIELTASSFLAALVQTASFLPMFLLSLPAGVLADTADRRRVMMISQGVYGAAALLLTLLAFTGHVGPASLLLFTFILGVCTAVQSPSWNSAVSDSVERAELPHGITLVSMAFNGARAAGPALAGVIFSLAGPGAVFVLSVLSVAAMTLAVRRSPPAQRPAGRVPSERLWNGMLSGLRFVRHSPAILAQLLRTVVFAGIGSALWALLPVIAQQQLGLGAAGFGLLMACLGCGAVAAGPFVGALRVRWPLNRLAAVASVLVAGAMLAAGLSRQRLLVYVALAGCGAGWMVMLTTLNAATQTSAASWVRARATSMHVLCSLGSFAFGSAVWGALAGAFGLGVTLCTAAVAMLASLALTRRLPLRMGHDKEVTMVTAWEEPLVVHEPEPEAGPVSVEVVYRIRPDDAPAFLATMEKLAAPRRRHGASLWRVYRDLGDPTRYVERFIVPSWADYLRQRERATLADEELEARARDFQVPGEAVLVHHYLAER